MEMLQHWAFATTGLLFLFAFLACVWTFLYRAGAVAGAVLAVALFGLLAVAPSIGAFAALVFAAVGAGQAMADDARPAPRARR